MGMKKTEIGMIPEEWDVQSFSDTFRVLNNNTYSRAELNYDSGQFKNIHYGDVLILFPEVLDCTREDVPYINDGLRISSSAQPLQDGDVVMADTAEDETVGKVTEVTNTSDKPVMAGLHTIPFRVKSGKFVPKWLGYYMNSHLYHDQLLPYIHGTKVSSVSKGSLGDTVIIVPKTFEQEKIVNSLSDVDALIENLKKFIRKKKDIRQGTMQMLVTGKKRLDGFDGDWQTTTLDKLCRLVTKEWERPGEVKSSVSIPYEKVEEISRKLNVIVYETQQSADSDGLAFKQSIAKSKQCYVLLRIMRKIVKGKGKCDRQAVDAEFVIELDGEESKLFKEMFAELLK